MNDAGGRFLRSYVGFVALAFFTAGGIAAIGYVPTVRLTDGSGAWSLLAGCGVSWVASCVGAIPLALTVSAKSSQATQAVLMSTAVRFLVVLVLVASLTFSGWLDRNVFVLWTSISYLLMLLVDTAFAIRVLNRATGNK